MESHQKMAAAYAEGWHNDLLTPFLGLTRDNNLRPDLTLEKLASLKPAFERSERARSPRKLHTADRWCLSGAAGQRGVGQGVGYQSWLTCVMAKQRRWILSTAPRAC